MSAIPKIGEGEWYVLKALWENAPLSGNDIVRAVSRDTDWSQSTILTMVRRLVKKKAVGVLQRSVMMYYPLVDENECPAHRNGPVFKAGVPGFCEHARQGISGKRRP